ncbi:hypothetical protein Tco_0934981 [Tanacetum coccineum]
MYHDLYFGRKTLIEKENVDLTFAQVSSKAYHEGVGLCVVDSYSGNHPEGGFTPFETIRRFLVVIRRSSYSSFEGEAFEPKRRDTIAVQHCCLSAKELNKFLSSYPIPSEYDVILPTSTQTIFDAPPEMDFKNFIYTEDDDDLAFLPKEPSLGFGIGSPFASVNTEPPKDVKEPEVQPAEVTADSGEILKASVFVMHPGSVAARIKECLPDCFELKDANALVDNAVNRRAREFLQVIERMSGEADIIKARERSHEEECEGLRAKCEAAMAEFDQNPIILAFREEILPCLPKLKSTKVTSLEADKARLEAVEASLHGEIEELRQDRRDVVSKVVPYAAIELVHSDELDRLVGKLVSSAITYGCCRAYEQVAAMKEPFDLSKVKGYHSSYKKEHTQASNDFATTMFPWLDEFVADAAASIEALLSKKPLIL